MQLQVGTFRTLGLEGSYLETFCQKMSAFWWKKMQTFYVKLLITILMIIGSLGMLFVYPTHATFCWEWGYPIFMTLEYSTVFFSTIFHALIYFDLGDFRLEVIGSWNSFDMPVVCI
uniref:CWH43-like N-terminal domain-containing protein n=1 Tax=Romanomermis culicivorax TaxID=13658 RepID=A0A915ISQ3_ROMCU